MERWDGKLKGLIFGLGNYHRSDGKFIENLIVI